MQDNTDNTDILIKIWENPCLRYLIENYLFSVIHSHLMQDKET